MILTVVALLSLALGLVIGWVLGITFAARNMVEATRRAKERLRAVSEELDR